MGHLHHCAFTIDRASGGFRRARLVARERPAPVLERHLLGEAEAASGPPFQLKTYAGSAVIEDSQVSELTGSPGADIEGVGAFRPPAAGRARPTSRSERGSEDAAAHAGVEAVGPMRCEGPRPAPG